MSNIIRRVPLASAQGGDVVVDWGFPHQVIDGFGGSDAFDNQTAMSSAQAALFFDPVQGIGLNIFRIGIDTDGIGNIGNWTNASFAASYGCSLMAVPWSAAAAQKDNGSITNGGHLLAGSYGAWSDSLAGFSAVCKSNTGSNLYAVAVQNEPDFTASYASMLYTAAEMTAFVKVLGPKLQALNPPVCLMLGEVSNWPANAQTYVTDTLGDATAAPYVNLLSGHQYGGLSALTGTGSLHNWETEFSYFTTFDATMTNGMTLAGDIHTALSTYNLNAWLWWDLLGYVYSDNEGLIGHDADTPPVATMTKRFYVLGNWSKFVRPGHFRVDVSNPPSGVSMTAFRHLPNRSAVIVAVNTNATTTAMRVRTINENLSNFVSVWETSAANNLTNVTSLNVSGGAFSYTLPATSVTTFVGNFQ